MKPLTKEEFENLCVNAPNYKTNEIRTFLDSDCEYARLLMTDAPINNQLTTYRQIISRMKRKGEIPDNIHVCVLNANGTIIAAKGIVNPIKNLKSFLE